jgi:hypothetical protein
MPGDVKVNGNLRLWFAVLGIVTGILAGGFGSAMVNSTKYQELDAKMDTHVADEFQEKVREEHRLTQIEAAIVRTNELLEDIKEALQKD